MACPQLEHGYTRIANELLFALAAADLTKREHAVLLVVLQWTYGYQRKAVALSTAQLARATRFAQPHCTNALASLTKKGLLILEQRGRTVIVAIQKDWERWALRGSVDNSCSSAPEVTGTGKGTYRQGNGVLPLPVSRQAGGRLPKRPGSGLKKREERKEKGFFVTRPVPDGSIARDPLYRQLCNDRTFGETVLRTTMALIIRDAGLPIDPATASIEDLVRAYRNQCPA